jgi:hypothetical protein
MATAGMTWSREGAAVGPTVSEPAGRTPSSQESLSAAPTTPPSATTWMAGQAMSGAIESTRYAVRLCAGTTIPSPAPEATLPSGPWSETSTVTGLPPGLVSTSRSCRPGAPPPARSHRSVPVRPQVLDARARRSPDFTSQDCEAASPGARAPSPVTSTLVPRSTPALMLTPRCEPASVSGLPAIVSSLTDPFVPDVCRPSSADSGAVAAATVVSVRMSSTPGTPVSSDPGQVRDEAVTAPPLGAFVALGRLGCEPSATVPSTCVAAATIPAPAAATTQARARPAMDNFMLASGTRGCRTGWRGKPAPAR